MIKELIEKMVASPMPFNGRKGKVLEVNVSARTCDVEPLDGTATIFDVQLQAFENNTEGVVLFPKQGSVVVVTFLSNETGYVSLTSEVDYFQYKIGAVDLRAELDKMFEVTTDLIGVLTNFQLLTNMGTTVQVMPKVVVDLEKLKAKNKAIQKNIQKLIH